MSLRHSSACLRPGRTGPAPLRRLRRDGRESDPSGLRGPHDGRAGQAGQGHARGRPLAVEEWNAKGGVLGKKIELLVGDDAQDPKQANAVANKMFTQGVVIVDGHYNSSCTIPASEVYNQRNMVCLTPASTNPQVTDRGYPTHLPGVRSGRPAGPRRGRVDRPSTCPDARVAVLDDKTTYGQGLAGEFTEELRGADGQEARLHRRGRQRGPGPHAGPHEHEGQFAGHRLLRRPLPPGRPRREADAPARHEGRLHERRRHLRPRVHPHRGPRKRRGFVPDLHPRPGEAPHRQEGGGRLQEALRRGGPVLPVLLRGHQHRPPGDGQGGDRGRREGGAGHPLHDLRHGLRPHAVRRQGRCPRLALRHVAGAGRQARPTPARIHDLGERLLPADRERAHRGRGVRPHRVGLHDGVRHHRAHQLRPRRDLHDRRLYRDHRRGGPPPGGRAGLRDPCPWPSWRRRL